VKSLVQEGFFKLPSKRTREDVTKALEAKMITSIDLWHNIGSPIQFDYAQTGLPKALRNYGVGAAVRVEGCLPYRGFRPLTRMAVPKMVKNGLNSPFLIWGQFWAAYLFCGRDLTETPCF
jgi:hypothetical protein